MIQQRLLRRLRACGNGVSVFGVNAWPPAVMLTTGQNQNGTSIEAGTGMANGKG